MIKKIMIIDDIEDILDIFKRLLVDKGFGVSIANNGTAGIELFKGESVDIVITDIDMPWMGCFGC